MLSCIPQVIKEIIITLNKYKNEVIEDDDVGIYKGRRAYLLSQIIDKPTWLPMIYVFSSAYRILFGWELTCQNLRNIYDYN